MKIPLFYNEFERYELMKIKQEIKRTYTGQLLISYLHCLESWIIPKLVSDEKAVKKYYRSITGKDINFDNPQSFCEKLNWYKLYGKKNLMQKCADKYAVRSYVRESGYEEILNDLYGVYYSVAEIDLSNLPERVVFKAAHGSHMSLVWPHSKFSWKQSKRLLASWLKQDIYWSGREWVYKDMPKRLIAERYLEDETGELRDYKLFCYNGVPHFLQFDAGRLNGNHIRNYYDMDLNLLEVTDSVPFDPTIVPIDKEGFEKMKKIASDLAKPFQFVRVDLYYVQWKIYFGELTFFDGGGNSGFSKEEYDIMFGKPWIIQK